MANDLDYLAASIHGRRSRLAEAERLDGLCRWRTIPELSRAVFPAAEVQSAAEFQRRAVEDLVRELSEAPRHLDVAGGSLVAWMAARFQVENLKALLRAFLNRLPLAAAQPYLVSLPGVLTLDAQALLAADTLERFVGRLPRGRPRQALRAALGPYGEPRQPFFFEAALDRGYFQELRDRAGRLAGADLELIAPLIEQEINTFQLMLVVRGKFGYGLTAEVLSPLHLRWCGLPTDRFNAMLAAPDLRTAASLTLGRVVDALPPERAARETSAPAAAAELEALAWNRFLRLAQRACRRSPLGLGGIVGYLGLRRVEVANLITLAEGLRNRVAPDAIRARLIPRRELGATDA